MAIPVSGEKAGSAEKEGRSSPGPSLPGQWCDLSMLPTPMGHLFSLYQVRL